MCTFFRGANLIFRKYILLTVFRVLLPIYDTYGDILLAFKIMQLGFILTGCAMLLPVVLATLCTLLATKTQRVLTMLQLYIPYRAVKVMMSRDSEWEEKKKDMDKSSSLIEPIIEAIPCSSFSRPFYSSSSLIRKETLILPKLAKGLYS